MSNSLSVVNYKSEYSSGLYPTFAIDGVPLEVWLPRNNRRIEPNLVAAHAGLYSDDDSVLIWDRIYSTAPGWSVLVPLLVCPEELDLRRYVVVTEQKSDGNNIQWCRFGLLRDLITLDSPLVDWYESMPSLIFERSGFHRALDYLRKQVNIKMDWD